MMQCSETDQLASIGFYTLEDERARRTSVASPLWRCELLLTTRCNFHCTYCRKRTGGDVRTETALSIIDGWCREGLRNVRFSGGEPTLHWNLPVFVQRARCNGVKRIAVSTNGSAPISCYDELLSAGVNDFSVSLDACCAATGNAMAGAKAFDAVCGTIRYLSARTYVTAGIVLTEENAQEAVDTILLADSLGVSDIRIIPAAQVAKSLPGLNIPHPTLSKYPILRYRIRRLNEGLPVRGLNGSDFGRCPLVLDDMAIDERGYHYPCIIYLREGGKPLGKFEGDMRAVRRERERWYVGHDCSADPICNGNCLDACVDYNNRVAQLKAQPHRRIVKPIAFFLP